MRKVGSDITGGNKNPADPFATLEPHDREIDELYVVQDRRPTDCEAPKLWKG